MRLFIAIVPPPAAVDELEAAAAQLRWTRHDAWHVTLAFLGEVDEVVSNRLAPRLERAAGRHPSLSLAFNGAGAFPGGVKARVLWTGLRGDRRGLAALAASVAAGARRAGAPSANEGRRFQPHITLARCRAPADVRPLVEALVSYAGTPWTAERIHLIRSHLGGRQPPRYETGASWVLRGHELA